MSEKKRFNAVDLIIVISVIAIAAVGFFAVKHFTGKTSEETKTIVLETKKKKEGFCDVVKVGEVAFDGVQNTELGKIKYVNFKPAVEDTISVLDGSIKSAEIPNRYDVYITIEVPADSDVAVGKQMWIETGTYKCDGYIVEVNYDGKAEDKE